MSDATTNYSIDDIRAFFVVDKMAARDSSLFEADLEYFLRDVVTDQAGRLAASAFREMIATLSNMEWYRRGSDTLTHAHGGKADSVSHGEGCLLDAPAAAKYLGLTLSQFRKLVAKGQIPFVPVTGVVNGDGRYQHKRFRREDLDRWAANNVVEARS